MLHEFGQAWGSEMGGSKEVLGGCCIILFSGLHFQCRQHAKALRLVRGAFFAVCTPTISGATASGPHMHRPTSAGPVDGAPTSWAA